MCVKFSGDFSPVTIPVFVPESEEIVDLCDVEFCASFYFGEAVTYTEETDKNKTENVPILARFINESTLSQFHAISISKRNKM